MGTKVTIKSRTVHPSTTEFHRILKQVADLHDKKGQDYGSETDPFQNVRNSVDFGVPAWLGCMIRANDKMKRLQTYAKRGSLANESVEDAFLDLAVYAIIGLVLWNEAEGETLLEDYPEFPE